MIITIEKIVYPGKSLGRGDDGIAVFTEGALPGETVEVELTKSKKTYREGRLTKVIHAVPERTAPRCPSFGGCGGCSFQYTDYRRQLSIKEACVKELLGPFGVSIGAVIPSPEECGYRNKMEFSFFREYDGVQAGLHAKGEFNRYFPVPECAIADPDFLPVLEAVVSFARASGLPAYDKRKQQGFYRHLVLRKGKRTGQVLVNLVTNEDGRVSAEFFAPLVEELKNRVTSFHWTVNTKPSDAVIADRITLLHGTEFITEELRVGGETYSFVISPFSFFQTNTLATEKLYGAVADALDGTGDDIVLDLYCGTGAIGIVLARHVREVLGVEQAADAVRNAEENSRRNNIRNIAFAAGSVEKWITAAPRTDFNVLVLDPPRGGISGKVVDFIVRTAPERIVYVSCNPSTLARDLKEIVEKGNYALRTIVPVDMFPQTYHVEAVASLIRLRSPFPPSAA